jgi:hypothetical protein
LTNLQPTYGNFKLQGKVQGLKRTWAFSDDSTKNGFPQHRLQFSVKTNEDNIVDVRLEGLGFENIRITPKDRNDKTKTDIKRGELIPEDHEVFMGVTVGLTQDDEGNNILENYDQYDAAKVVHEKLQDGDLVYIGGRNEYNMYTNRNGEEVINGNLSINRIFTSKRGFNPEAEDFEEMSAFDQFIVLNAVDLDKKTKKAHVSAFVLARSFGEMQVIPYHFWIDGKTNAGLAKKLSDLPFGTQIKVSGKIHSQPIYAEVEAQEVNTDPGWGEFPTGFTPRQNEGGKRITGVDKSLEITRGYPETLEEAKYTQEDLFPPEQEQDDSENPFAEKKEDKKEEDVWGTGDSADDPFKVDEDTF